jgi:hypothetical protein
MHSMTLLEVRTFGERLPMSRSVAHMRRQRERLSMDELALVERPGMVKVDELIVISPGRSASVDSFIDRRDRS